MPSQSPNKPFPIRLDPELRQRVKNAGGGVVVRELIQFFIDDTSSGELGDAHEKLVSLEKTPLKDIGIEQLDALSRSLQPILRWEKDELRRHQTLSLFGRIEWLKIRKSKQSKRRNAV